MYLASTMPCKRTMYCILRKISVTGTQVAGIAGGFRN
jgi:hypothetical protein